MTYARPDALHDPDTIPRMPSWVTSARSKTPEDMAFLSGAALAALHLVLAREKVPQTLLRERLALRAAEACVRFSGRSERAGELRDEIHLLRPGDQPGPAGATFLQWRKAVARPISVGALHKAMPKLTAEQIATWLDTGEGGPVAKAATVLETVLAEFPGEDAVALILADAALAQACGWDHAVPLFAAGLKHRDLRKTGEDLRLACHRPIVSQAEEAVRVAHDLAHRAARLNAVAPKLRAKGAGAAVDLFLTRDALSPSVALAGPAPGVGMSDRAARRLCDRLVELGAVRELTGRDTFRLYGV